MVNGQQVQHKSHKELIQYRRHEVGFVFQFYNLIQNLTALENVELAAQITPDFIPANEILAKVGLGDRLNNFPAQLSGGEQQRVAIARALAKKPKLLLCDEPTGALDYETGKQILAELDRLVREQGKTVVIVTHTREIGKMAHRVIRMRSGRIEGTETNAIRQTAAEIEW
jgi:putative ABC transport system ATP-binding protein